LGSRLYAPAPTQKPFLLFFIKSGRNNGPGRLPEYFKASLVAGARARRVERKEVMR